MRLNELIEATDVVSAVGDLSREVTDLAYDSRRVGEGTVFFAFPGERADGHAFAAAAAEAGAAGIVLERNLDVNVAQVRVADARAAMAPLAARFNGDPTARLALAGITGTNGKTTTAFMVREILEAAGRQSGLMGTVKQVVGGAEEEVVRTTPEAIDLQATFARMEAGGDVACVMEVSSHALSLHRCDAIHFDVAVFTNLTQDHLDFHVDMEDYFQAKRLLFGMSPAAVVNIDDPFGARLAEEIECVTVSAEGAEADFRALRVSFDATGSRFHASTIAGDVDARTPMPGHFNVANALAALATGSQLGVDLGVAAGALASAGLVPGRFEPVDEGQDFAVIVDYSHTPDSIENALRAARPLTEGRLISVFGAGGDRDARKRPLMGRAGAELSDVAIVTSDNPRSEEPASIVDQVLAGTEGAPAEVVSIVDRREAIAHALERARPGDTVLIAGKGHEQGQEFEDGRKIPFDDREVARAELQRIAAR